MHLSTGGCPMSLCPSALGFNARMVPFVWICRCFTQGVPPASEGYRLTLSMGLGFLQHLTDFPARPPAWHPPPSRWDPVPSGEDRQAELRASDPNMVATAPYWGCPPPQCGATGGPLPTSPRPQQPSEEKASAGSPATAEEKRPPKPAPGVGGAVGLPLAGVEGVAGRTGSGSGGGRLRL